jgi:multidrug resistance efflux pump
VKSLTPIPTPPHLRWREFRLKILPTIVFLAVMAVTVSVWVRFAAAPNVVGQAETIHANLVSSKPGILTQFTATLNQPVHAGDVLAVVIPDPRVLERSLALIQAEIEQTRLGLNPIFSRERTDYQVENFQLRELESRTRLATAKVKLQYNEAQFVRISGLFLGDTNNVVSQATYDAARRDVEVARADVEEETHFIAGIEATLKHLDTVLAPSVNPADAIRAAINVQEKKLALTEAELGPVNLLAPIEGVVSAIAHRNGENVSLNETILTVTSAKATRIVAYVPQPISVEPVVGMPVRVTSRSLRRNSGVGHVESVGAWMSPISPALLSHPLPQQFVQIGLPVWVSVPPGMNFRPGELVALDFDRAN